VKGDEWAEERGREGGMERTNEVLLDLVLIEGEILLSIEAVVVAVWERDGVRKGGKGEEEENTRR
jgi:hypothetical protein